MIIKKTKVSLEPFSNNEVVSFIEESSKEGKYIKHYIDSGIEEGKKMYLLEVRIDKEES